MEASRLVLMEGDSSRSTAVIEEIPFVDLSREHERIADELRAAFDRVVAHGGFTLGDEVERFEEEFARYCGVQHCVGVASGTAALTLSLIAAGVGPDDEVVVPAHTFIATALAVVHAGATPVFCDVDDDTGLIDADAAAAACSSRTAAIVPVHLYGQIADMDAITALARQRGLIVLEDAAQAHGARWRGGRAGSFGDAAGFSFYPSKNLGGLGDGGAVCTNSDQIAAGLRRLRNLGQERKGEHLILGYNERLDGLQAALLRVKLGWLDEANRARRGIAATYRAELPAAARPMFEDPRGEPVYHLFPVRVRNREAVRARLRDLGVQTGVHYWPAAHRHPAFRETARLGGPEPEVALRWSEETLSLPMFAQLTPAEVARTAEVLSEVLGGAE